MNPIFAACALSAALSLPAPARADDCNNDGIPDDQLGAGLLFFDTFPSIYLDPEKWIFQDGVTVDGLGLAEPTPPYSLRLNSDPCHYDTIISRPIDLSQCSDVVLHYDWQRTGGGEQPHTGKDLFISYRKADGSWSVLVRHLGGEEDMETFDHLALPLPPDAYHDAFQLRFHNSSAVPGAYGPWDDWFIDDVFFIAGVPDCNHNGVPDDCDIANEASTDCNGNGIPDECDVADRVCIDCNSNGIPDECDVDSGFSVDDNEDVIPDECQDCNHNELLDPVEIAVGSSQDCNCNEIPDECDLAAGLDSDCDGNGVPDVCDIASYSYRHDDGIMDWFAGAWYPQYGLVWLNRFTVQPGGEYVDRIDIAWGRAITGFEVTIAVWSDPDDDGDPANATLLYTAPITVVNPETNRFAQVEIPPTFVGQSGEYFYAGAFRHYPCYWSPVAIDSQDSHGCSFSASGSNLDVLGDNPLPPFINPGNFMIRAVSTARDCDGNGVFDVCDIADRAAYDNNRNLLPDACEWGSAAGLELLPDADCYAVDDEIRIEIWMHDVPDPIVGGQFFFDYDPDRLEMLDISPAGAPWPFTVELYECSVNVGGSMPQCQSEPGRIDYAVGVEPGAPLTTGSALMAVLRFRALQPICAIDANLLWGTQGFIRLGTSDSMPVNPLLINAELGDARSPEILVPLQILLEINQVDVCNAVADIVPDATDDCDMFNNLILAWERSDGHISLGDPFAVADSPITINWLAQDLCGQITTAETTVTVILLGDLDYDLDVDLGDLAQLLGRYGLAEGTTYEDGDLDHDGDVDLADLAALLSVYANACP